MSIEQISLHMLRQPGDGWRFAITKGPIEMARPEFMATRPYTTLLECAEAAVGVLELTHRSEEKPSRAVVGG